MDSLLLQAARPKTLRIVQIWEIHPYTKHIYKSKDVREESSRCSTQHLPQLTNLIAAYCLSSPGQMFRELTSTQTPPRMQFTFPALVKVTVFAAMANTVAVVALPEPVGLEARQLSCLPVGDFCTPGAANGCCTGAACTGLSLLGLPFLGVSPRHYLTP